MKTINLTKRERKAAQLLCHYSICERLALACGMPASKTNGKRISVKLMQLEHIVSLCSVAYCNGERLKVSEGGFQDSLMPEYLDFGADGPKAWERVKTRATDSVRNILGDIPPGFFVNTDPRGYALKIDNENAEGRALIDSLSMHTDWGGYGILSPEIDGN